MDNEEDRQSLLVQGINLRDRQIPLHLQNPHNPSIYQPDTIRIKIKNVSLSADDGQIDRALAMEGCEIQGIFRDETKQDDSKGRKTNKQSHVDVDVTITNKNKSTKLPPKKLLPLKVI